MLESLVVNLGYRSSSLFGEEFLSAPIHSPLFGRLVGPSSLPANGGASMYIGLKHLHTQEMGGRIDME
jgi:hypothetical protein